MDKNEQKLLFDVLNQAHLAEMPKKADNKTVWIEAVAKIRLANNSIGYGIVKRYDLDSEPVVTYINGDVFAIIGIEEVYPFIVLQKEYIKKFTAKEKENARINYLKSLHMPYLEGVSLEDMTMEELNKEVVRSAFHLQLKDMNK